MKRFLLLLFTFAIFDMASVGQYVILDGRQFKDENGDDFYPVVCNYLVNIVNVNPFDFSTTFISPEHSWGTNNYFECNSTSTCDQKLQNDFLQILWMGFNAIRLMGINPVHIPEGTILLSPDPDHPECDWTCPVTGFYINTLNHPLLDCLYDTRFLIQPPFTDDVSTRLFEHMAHFITLVSQTDLNGKRLKIILVSGGGGGWYNPDEYPGAYSEYLEAFSEALMTYLPPEAQSTLFAYDLDNEPLYSWNGYSLWPHVEVGHAKEDVCNNVNLWNNSIKLNDPNHLITLGGCGLSDIFEYDPVVLNVDFYSAHLYPSVREYEQPEYFSGIMNRIYGNYYWYHQNFPMAWIIGETGFTAQTSFVFPELNGDLNEQYDYADYTLPLAWHCNGSGYSWWTYQNFHWGNPGNYYGILDYGECSPIPCNSIAKPVHQVFKEFIPPQGPYTCAEPADYYDPFQHAFYSDNTNIVTGHVQDQYGFPIQDALVQGWTRLYGTPPDDVYNIHYTFTKPNGDFTLIPYDYDSRPPNLGVIEAIRISAPFGSRARLEWYSAGVPSVNSFTLTKSTVPFEETFENIVVAGNQTVIVQAWDEVNVSDVEIQPQGSCEIMARREINVGQEFFAQANSETWIHTDMPCEGLTGLIKKKEFSYNYDTMEGFSKNSEILLQFTVIETNLNINVYPNPGTGRFMVEIKEDQPSQLFTIIVINQLTNIVFTTYESQPNFTLDLSHLSKGIYFLQINTGTQSQTKKIIII